MISNKCGVIFGISNERSIAWGILSAISQYESMKVLLICVNDRIKDKVLSLIKQHEKVASAVQDVLTCDVSSPEQICDVASKAHAMFDRIDFIIHAVAFIAKEELHGKFIDTKLSNFLEAMNISCYSLISIAHNFYKYMPPNGSIVALSYYGAQKVIPYYNAMGACKAALETSVKYLSHDLGEYSIRINAISAGPIRTLAASGIKNFHDVLEQSKIASPLQNNLTQYDVGGMGVFLVSDASKMVTGTTMYIDCGYSTIGMYIGKK